MTEYQKLLNDYDAFLGLKTDIENALTACDIIDETGEINSFRSDCYFEIKERLQECLRIAEKAQTSFSREIKPEDF